MGYLRHDSARWDAAATKTMGSMEENPKVGCLFLTIALVLLGFGIWGGMQAARSGVGTLIAVAREEFATATTTVVDLRPLATPKPTFTPATTATMLRAITPTLATTVPTLTPSPTPVPVQFRVLSQDILFRSGPGTAYPPIAFARQGALLPVVGRTADGIWWQVCCMEQQAVWMELSDSTLLETGDVGTVPILDVPVYNAPPTPTPPLAPGVAVRVEPTPTPPPPGDPTCATGASYDTILTLGAPHKQPVANSPELNLSLRGYSPYAGFTQMVWLGGDTDPHAPQLNTLFADQRIDNDFAGVYRVHQWNWQCNCRGAPIGDPEVTLSAISSRPGEMLHTPDRTNGDIGGDYRAMVLYASPSQITLKYTREDNMLFGYGIHIEGICVDPNLLDLYYRMDREGRKSLPVLRGMQPIGYSMGGDVKVAVRDTGQFMDPRSKKDWWEGME